MHKNILTLLIASSVLISAPVSSAYAEKFDTDSKWDVLLGIGGASVPEYAGAEDQEFIALPLIMVDYEFHEQNHLFINTFKGAGYEFDGERINWGVNLGWRRGRDDGDSERLEGMGDLDGTITAGFFGGFNFGQLKLRVNYDAGLDNNNDGALTTLSGKYFMRSLDGKLGGYIGAKAVYGDDAYHENYFSVTPANVTPDRPEYEGEAGFVKAGLVFGVNYLLNERHYFGFDTSYMDLSTDVTNSPITEENYEYTAAISYGYKF